jgi:hypothetical protein
VQRLPLSPEVHFRLNTTDLRDVAAILMSREPEHFDETLRQGEKLTREELFLANEHQGSGFVAILDDDGTSAWLYLRQCSSGMPIADAWVFNRVPAPPASAIQSYRGRPPPAAQGYAGDEALCPAPANHEWSFVWSPDGKSVAVLMDGRAVACIIAGDKRGYSRNLVQDGPWGHPWSDAVYDAAFGSPE